MSEKDAPRSSSELDSLLRANAGESVAEFVQSLLPKEGPKSQTQNQQELTNENGRTSPSTIDKNGRAVEQNSTDKSRSNDQNTIDKSGRIGDQNTVDKTGRANDQNTIDKSGDLKHSEKGGHTSIEEMMRRFHEKPSFQIVGSDETGVIDLNTGDKLLRLKGHEVLVMPDGGALIVKPDGSYELSSKTPATVKHDAATNTTTLEMGKGQSITIKDGRITEVERNGSSASMVSPKRIDKPDFPTKPSWPGKFEHSIPSVPGGRSSAENQSKPNMLPNVEIHRNSSSETQMIKPKSK